MKHLLSILLLTLFALLAIPVYAVPGSLQFEAFDPTKLAATPVPNGPKAEKCSSDFGVGTDAFSAWFFDSLNRVWIFTGGLSGTAPNQASWVADKRVLYLTASEQLFGVRSYFIARALLKLQITTNYPGRPAPVGRVQIPEGYRVTESGFMQTYHKTYDTLSALSCSERVAFLQPSTGTPLFIYTDQPTPIDVSLGSQKLFQGTIYPGSIFQTGDHRHFAHLDYDVALPTIPKVRSVLVSQEKFSSVLDDLFTQAHLNLGEKIAFKDYLYKKLPQARSYYLGVFSDAQTQQLLPLSLTPPPNYLYRLILYIKPLVEKPAVQNSGVLSVPKVQTRDHLTAIDLGVVIDW